MKTQATFCNPGSEPDSSRSTISLTPLRHHKPSRHTKRIIHISTETATATGNQKIAHNLQTQRPGPILRRVNLSPVIFALFLCTLHCSVQNEVNCFSQLWGSLLCPLFVMDIIPWRLMNNSIETFCVNLPSSPTLFCSGFAVFYSQGIKGTKPMNYEKKRKKKNECSTQHTRGWSLHEKRKWLFFTLLQLERKQKEQSVRHMAKWLVLFERFRSWVGWLQKGRIMHYCGNKQTGAIAKQAVRQTA